MGACGHLKRSEKEKMMAEEKPSLVSKLERLISNKSFELWKDSGVQILFPCGLGFCWEPSPMLLDWVW